MAQLRKILEDLETRVRQANPDVIEEAKSRTK